MKKGITILFSLVVMTALGFSGVSCTKKLHVVGPERATSAPVRPEDREEKAQKISEDENGSYKISDLASEEKPRDLSKDEKLKSEIDEFESRPVYFDYDESDLKPAARENLSKRAAWLKSNSEYSILIEGHCDERGTNEYNLALGDRRAEVAKRYLINQGISGQRIETISYGEERPADREHNEEAWAKNRRDEFRIIR